ncbi:MAG: ATP-binding cassette domain-containing protein [Xanthomonadales bacterium]|nr:ATP-binding cassette domain-containing protein [Xanthomonadales bacterium]
MIRVQDVYKSFGEVKAVQGVSFEAPDGRITGLLGPNGAGKSTTLRMLYTVLRPDTGSATIDGHDVVNSPLQARRAIGPLPHGSGIYPRLTARENIRYYGKLNGMSGKSLEQRIDQLSDMLEMEEFMDRRTKGFSQGQRTKVALARAIVHEPRNVILDEPTNGLDVMATRALRDLIRKLRDHGKCVLFSSHVMQEVAALCDRIVIIARGRVVAQGSPDALRSQTGKDNLEDAFVAAIGSEEGLE